MSAAPDRKRDALAASAADTDATTRADFFGLHSEKLETTSRTKVALSMGRRAIHCLETGSVMKTKLPPDIIFHHDLRLMVLRPRGILNRKRVKTIIDFLDKEEERAQKPFNRFSDLSKVDAIDLDFSFAFQVALHRRLTYGKRPPIKSAFYVTTAEAAQLVRIHAFVTDHSPIQVKMFTELSEAAKWLGVSQDTLEIDIPRP